VVTGVQTCALPIFICHRCSTVLRFFAIQIDEIARTVQTPQDFLIFKMAAASANCGCYRLKGGRTLGGGIPVITW